MCFFGYELGVINFEMGLPKGWEKYLVLNQLGMVKSTTDIKSSDFQSYEAIPMVDQSRTFIAGYTDYENAKIHFEGKPYIVYGDHSRIFKLINFDFGRGADGTQIIVYQKNHLGHSTYFIFRK